MRKRNTIGLILILVGIAWIIDLTGVIHVDWLESVKKLWPVLFIAIGVSMVAARYKFVSSVVWILTFAVFIGFGIYNSDEKTYEREIEWSELQHVEVRKTHAKDEIVLDGDIEEAKLIIELGTVKVNIADGNEDLLAKLDTNIPNLEQQLAKGQQAVLKYVHQEHEKSSIIRSFDLQVNPAIPWEIEANLSVVDGKFDLAKVPVKKLNMKLGVGDLDLIIGQQQHTIINIQAGATDLDIYIPEGVGLMVKTGKLLTNLSFHNIEMTNQDNVLTSDNYEQAEHKVEMHIQSAVSTIEIFAE